MTPFTSNYETIKETSSKDKSLDLALISGDMTIPSQGKIQSTFLQSVLSNKFTVAFVVVLLGTGLMAYNINPVPPSNRFSLGEYAAIVDGSKGGGFTASENGNEDGGGSVNCPWPYHCRDEDPDPNLEIDSSF
eukprot:CAMPEP_0170994248 /NCGR_PEP_ID=MMETSP0736-20130129/10841_1 /TAXON_ID=186038 /ORGANISM="Fragilariopsis kerguelensis, Strain L26-C5" /LENGTH=132 /DNA_ID=CAMNT_0011420091 /DNA_START=80 /DNA_END=478 /DNA_ORIENTATION=+